MTPDPEDTLAQQEVEGRKDFTIHGSWRSDGGLRIFSDDIPGLILSSADPVAVLGDLGPALIELLARRPEHFGHVTPAEDHAAYLASDSGPYGFGDIELPEENSE